MTHKEKNLLKELVTHCVHDIHDRLDEQYPPDTDPSSVVRAILTIASHVPINLIIFLQKNTVSGKIDNKGLKDAMLEGVIKDMRRIYSINT